MNPETLIKKLKESDNQVLQAAAADFPKWLKLKHTKDDLELFLEFNIAYVKYRPLKSTTYKTGIFTSNTRLIDVLNARNDKDKQQKASKKYDGIRTKDKTSVMSFDILSAHLTTINLESWEIISFITINPDNAVILDEVLTNILHPSKVKKTTE